MSTSHPTVEPPMTDAHPAEQVPRAVAGGLLMGLANLVPGISGGTMLLAAGVYEGFVDAVSEITTLKFKRSSLLLLGTIVLSATVAVILGAGMVKNLVVEQRWIMYSLFIGLTLGGVPLLWRLAKPAKPSFFVGAVVGLGVMIAMALLQPAQGSASSNPLSLGLAGVAGASAMILPGLSGGYLLLLMGQYIPILSGLSELKDALKAMDIAAIMDVGLSVIMPVGLGVVIGVVAVSNLVKWLLDHHRQLTLGLLMGLVLGAVFGLWPFQEILEPVFGETIIKGQVVTADNIAGFDREDYPTGFFTPTGMQAVGSLALMVVGYGITVLVAKFGGHQD